MIIKIIPENDIEKARIKKVEHKGVKEFFMFGNKQDEEGDLVDFHDWKGGYRYLVGSLHYFQEMITEEMHGKGKSNTTEIALKPQGQAPLQMPPPKTPFIKTGSPQENDVQIVNAEDLKVIPMPPPAPQQADEEADKSDRPIIVDVEREDAPEPVDDDNDEAGVDK